MSATLKKPTLNPSAQALGFAKPSQPPEASNRVFFAPAGHRRLTINLPIDLHRRLKQAALDRDCTATDIIEQMLERELAGK